MKLSPDIISVPLAWGPIRFSDKSHDQIAVSLAFSETAAAIVFDAPPAVLRALDDDDMLALQCAIAEFLPRAVSKILT